MLSELREGGFGVRLPGSSREEGGCVLDIDSPVCAGVVTGGIRATFFWELTEGIPEEDIWQSWTLLDWHVASVEVQDKNKGQRQGHYGTRWDRNTRSLKSSIWGYRWCGKGGTTRLGAITSKKVEPLHDWETLKSRCQQDRSQDPSQFGKGLRMLWYYLLHLNKTSAWLRWWGL